MSAYPSQEFRPLKKPRLGPPDVYPQDPKQKEDELTQHSVKHGFANNQTFGDEYGSARRENINQDKFGSEFISVLDKKKDVNTFQDTSKKKQQPTKDNFWPAAKNKNAMEAWFKDLAGNKPLSQLWKKVPTFNKKEEIFSTLCEFAVPMVKAAWFIKMTAAYNVAMQENKTKKRNIIDQSVDWCQSLTKFLRDQIQKIQDPYHNAPGGPTSGFLTVNTTNPALQVDLDLALKQWHYSSKLARHLYDEGLLDRHEFLSWLIELLEKLKQNEDTVLKLVMAQILQYLDEITMTVLLSRRLAHFAAKKIAALCTDTGGTSPQNTSPIMTNNSSGMTSTNSSQLLPQNPLAAVFAQYNNCPQHRGIILSLSATLQVITLLCPSSLVWNNLGEGKSSSMLCGSPLDLLPCAPSSLPMPPGPENPQIRAQIRSVENQLRQRGRAAEVRWSSDKCQQSTRGFMISKKLEVLDMLDRHNFDKVENTNSLDTLYSKVFNINQNKDGTEPLVSDEPIIHLLIDWAVSTHRTGNYRAVVVAKLLEKRQNELRAEKFGDTDMLDDKDSMGSDAMVTTGLPAFQGLLMNFLDDRAPVLDDNPSDECRQGFANLIQLFCELIRHDVFSHDAYMCTLISRGDLSSPAIVPPLAADSIDLSSVKSQMESIKHEHQDDIKVDIDINTMESDYGSLFDSVRDEQKASPEEPASVKSAKSEKDQQIPSVGIHHVAMEPPQPPKGPSRHMVYAQHFPIPKDAIHECNQRGIVLYGVGKARDDARHIVKKISKETLKLFSKKNCVDTGSGDLGKVKKRKEKEPGDTSSVSLVTNFEQIFEGIFSKFQKLSYFDQHFVTAQCTETVLEQINSFTSGICYLPLVENISYLFDLMEFSLNIYGLLEFSVKLLKELSTVEHHLSSQNSSLAGNYTTYLCLCIVGVFRKYHPYLLVSQDLIIQAFDGLIGAVKDVYNPAVCTSAERCILVYLYNAYTSCSYLRDKKSEMFSNSFRKIKMTLYADINPSASNLLWDPGFMMEVMSTIKSQPDSALTKQLTDNPANRYSFVCNAMLNICNSQEIDRLNGISVLCAELTARCNSLSSEWLGVLQALCCSSNHSCGFIDVLTQIDVGDMSIHDSLAVFTAILIARHCFSLQDLVVHVVLPSLLAARPSASGDQDAEPGARLTCHILLKLFKTSDSALTMYGQSSYNRQSSNIKASCDRHLLAAAHDSITVGPVLAVLKAMLMLSDQTSDEMKSKSGGSSKKEDKGGDIFSTLLNSLEDDGDMDMMLGTSKSKGGIESAGLSEFARHALMEMCAQDWVQEKFLKNPESVLSSDLLLDPMLTNKQAQQLLQMICYPHGIPNQVEGSEPDNKQIIHRILQTLNQWGLRVSLLELQLMFKQATTQTETNSILENIAKGTIDLFHQQTESNRNMGDADHMGRHSSRSESDGVWMVGPLIAKLPSQVQGRVLKLAGQVLESGNNFLSKGKFDKEKNQRSKSLLGHQPFLSLVLTCLKGQDEQREGLLCSLLNQLEKFISICKDALDKTPDEFKVRHTIHEALLLRLSLVGGMFDTIQRNTSNTTDWAILLLQLVTNGIVDAQSNNELFTIILDMLSVLVHGTLITEGSEKEENKRTYMNLIKKLRREMGDKNSDSMDKIRQLLPLPKKMYEVITCEPHGTTMDSKGNKYDMTGMGKKEVTGLKVAKKEKMSPWEVIEGYKNPPPLSWPYFCATKLEKKPLKYEEQHRLLLYHTHSLRHPLSHYLDPPALPPEDLEPPPEKVEEKVKEQSESQATDKRPKKKPKRVPRPPPNNSFIQQTPVRPMNYPDPMYPSNAHPSWYPPQQQTPSYYPPQQLPPAGTRFPQYSNPKQAIQSMLKMRHPTGSNYPNQHPSLQALQLMQKQQRHNMVRQQLRNHFPRTMTDNQGIYSNAVPSGGMHGMNQSQVGMSPNYGPSYNMQPGQPGMMDQGQPAGGMMPAQGYNQSMYQGGQNPSMMGGMANQQGYMPQHPPSQTGVNTPQTHFNPSSSRLQHSISSSNLQSSSSSISGMSQGMSSYNQMPSSGPPQMQGGNQYMPMMAPHQQQQQQQIQMQQRRRIAMQQQNPQAQMSNNQMMAQLQRQISGPPGPQYNTYGQPPQYP